MATMPAPKSPAGLLLLAGAALWLLSRPKTASASTAANTPNGRPVQTYANPIAVAGDLAAQVAAMLFRNVNTGSPAVGGVSTTTGVVPVGDDARAAVRAGDEYYGTGQIRWYAGNAEAARAAVREGDSYYSGWAAPAVLPVAGTVTAFNTFGGNSVDDTTPAAPYYDPAEQINFNPLAYNY